MMGVELASRSSAASKRSGWINRYWAHEPIKWRESGDVWPVGVFEGDTIWPTKEIAEEKALKFVMKVRTDNSDGQTTYQVDYMGARQVEDDA